MDVRTTLIDQVAVGIGNALGSGGTLPVGLNDLHIRTKDRGNVRLVPNVPQQMFLDSILPNWRDGDLKMRSLRAMLLKARQEGFSTLILALMFIDTLTTPNTHTVVIAHDQDSTERLFQIVQRYERHLPESMRPRKRYSNRREFVWEGLDSAFYVGTAGAGSYGRGGTINNVHASEVAFWPDAKKILSGLFQAVPADGNIFLESTANGYGNYFEQEWGHTETGESRFTGHFFGWDLMQEYRLNPNDPLALHFLRTLSGDDLKEEQRLREVVGLDEAQIAWRRVKKVELRELFAQEFPLTADEAFLATGAAYFNRAILKEMLDSLGKPEYVDLPDCELSAQIEDLTDDGYRGFRVYEAPEPGETYVIGADPAEGIRKKSEEHDYCAAQVINRKTWRVCAVLHGRWDPHDFGLMLGVLGTIYNNALIGVERNNHGHATLAALVRTYGYPLARPRSDEGGVYQHAEWDAKGNLIGARPGYPTTPKTKTLALDTLDASVSERDIVIRDRPTLIEMRRFVKLPGGGYGAEADGHDDLVMSLAIATVIATLGPTKREVEVY